MEFSARHGYHVAGGSIAGLAEILFWGAQAKSSAFIPTGLGFRGKRAGKGGLKTVARLACGMGT